MSSIYQCENDDAVDGIIAIVCFLAPFLIIAYYMVD